jgi:hypothetical protein
LPHGLDVFLLRRDLEGDPGQSHVEIGVRPMITVQAWKSSSESARNGGTGSGDERARRLTPSFVKTYTWQAAQTLWLKRWTELRVKNFNSPVTEKSPVFSSEIRIDTLVNKTLLKFFLVPT